MKKVKNNFKKGIVKFVDTLLCYPELSSFQKIFIQSSDCVVSPEELEAARNQDPNPEFDPHAVEAWKIGMLALVMGTLSKDEEIYSWEEGIIRDGVLNSKLEEFSGRYSPLLAKLVSTCLAYYPEGRPNLTELLEFLIERKTEED